MDDLHDNQQALRERLKKLLEDFKNHGFGQNQQGQHGQGQDGMDQLGRAGEAMGEAEGRLGEGNADSAVDSQGRALEALRKGAQGLAQSMQQQLGQGTVPGATAGTAGSAPTATPIRSTGRCTGANLATMSRSKCRARSTCSAPAASSKSFGGASATCCVRRKNSITSSGCSRIIERLVARSIERLTDFHPRREAKSSNFTGARSALHSLTDGANDEVRACREHRRCLKLRIG